MTQCPRCGGRADPGLTAVYCFTVGCINYREPLRLDPPQIPRPPMRQNFVYARVRDDAGRITDVCNSEVSPLRLDDCGSRVYVAHVTWLDPPFRACRVADPLRSVAHHILIALSPDGALWFSKG